MKCNWVVIKYDVQPNEFVCERCGINQVFPEGYMAFSMLKAMGDSFLKSHKKCKEVKE